jgi:hypothetical protein
MYKSSVIGSNFSAILFVGNSHALGSRLEFKQRLSIAHGTAKGKPSHHISLNTFFCSSVLVATTSTILNDDLFLLSRPKSPAFADTPCGPYEFQNF